MKIALRADANEHQGTGHVMRCLTLAEAFIARGHSVVLLGNIGSILWLREALEESSVEHLECEPESLDIDLIVAANFDGVVVDSYQIPSELISHLNTRVPCLAIIDGDARGIIASLYLDQNLGASMNGIPAGREATWLGGSEYALVRDAVLAQRLAPTPGAMFERAHIVAFMGGTDPDGAIHEVAESIVAEELDIDLTLISPQQWLSQVEAAVLEQPRAKVIEPTVDLPRVLGQADIVVSAAGTSAWDICTMARPAVLVAVVGNQRASLASIAREGVALSIDATPEGGKSLSEVGTAVTSLVNSSALRHQLADRCFTIFDGQGKDRVTEAVERLLL